VFIAKMYSSRRRNRMLLREVAVTQVGMQSQEQCGIFFTVSVVGE